VSFVVAAKKTRYGCAASIGKKHDLRFDAAARGRHCCLARGFQGLGVETRDVAAAAAAVEGGSASRGFGIDDTLSHCSEGILF
jgi:hypothetical protein